MNAVKPTQIEKDAVFEPKIIAYLCTWCSYTGADTAGIARLKSPANIRAIRVPCSGRVSPEVILRTFEEGADGVLVLGCHIGECHYDNGNHRTAKRLPILRALLSFAGLEPERLKLDWVSASEGERFSKITTEFTQQVRKLGPARWRISMQKWQSFHQLLEMPEILESKPNGSKYAAVKPLELRPSATYTQIEMGIQETAQRLLSAGEVTCVIGYERGPRGRVRPVFISKPDQAKRLVWNSECTHNLATYLNQKIHAGNQHEKSDHKNQESVAVVAKPCDSRAIQVLLTEKRFPREKVHIIGVVCDGVQQTIPANKNRVESPVSPTDSAYSPILQTRCLDCDQRTPIIYDTFIGSSEKATLREKPPLNHHLENLEGCTPLERAEYWLSQFDRCIRCYACRQVCPICDCPVCLYERDDSLWSGMGTGLIEKRAFHLGRAFHLAGRCVGCNECERVCPMDIPISLLNIKLTQEIQNAFEYQAGLTLEPSPLVTVLSGEERLS
jgi:coenzyme F420-reducing hydrogenase delta subunit/ferredoxin